MYSEIEFYPKPICEEELMVNRQDIYLRRKNRFNLLVERANRLSVIKEIRTYKPQIGCENNLSDHLIDSFESKIIRIPDFLLDSIKSGIERYNPFNNYYAGDEALISLEKDIILAERWGE